MRNTIDLLKLYDFLVNNGERLNLMFELALELRFDLTLKSIFSRSRENFPIRTPLIFSWLIPLKNWKIEFS